MSTHTESGENYEQKHVHDVYEEIASHFSSTRYKPWPVIERFLKALPDGSIGLDVGCGNGKYLAVNSNVFILGSDRSSNLINIAKKHHPHSVVVADVLDLPHPPGTFDFIICIAVIHHLSTPERRVQAISSLIDRLTQGCQALIFVWALEQGNSRRGWTSEDAQDVMVPWVSRGSKKTPASEQSGAIGSGENHTSEDKVFHRYYHLYAQNELENDISLAGGIVVDAGYEKDNWWAIATKKPH